jgi:hypothetical protein
MGLLAPLFLAGLLAVAIPIVVHLVHRERKEPLAFPSLMFLRRVPFRSARRQRIRYWLLFLMRVAALLLIATAFARPWVRRAAAPASSARDGRDIVVLMDRSYSMSAAPVWPRAQRALREAVASVRDQDRVAVIAFAEQAELVARLDDPRSIAEAAAQNLQPGRESTRYAPAFKLAGSVLAQSRGPAEIVVVTDRQRSGWRNLEQVAVPANTKVRVVDVSAAALSNLAISDVQLARSTFAGRQRIMPSARLVNRGTQDVTVPVVLSLGDRVQQSRTVEVKAQGTAQVSFDAMFASSLAGEIRIARDDDVAADNAVFFTTESSGAPSVRVVTGTADAAYYFENALNAGSADAFSVQRASSRFSPADLQDVNVIVLLESALPGGQLGEQLAEFVRQGGGLVIVGGSGTRAHPLAPLRNAEPVRRDNDPASLVSVDALHPVFEPFRATGASQFASARFNRFQRGSAVASAQVVARFDDGAPALLEQRFGRGRILQFAAGLTRAAGDFVLQPAFVPFVQQLVRHAAANNQAQSAFTVGQVLDVNAFAPGDRDAVVYSPSGQRTRMAAAQQARTLRVAEAGIYQIRATGENAVTQLAAANIDVSESDVTPIGTDIFQDAVTARTQPAAALPAALQPRDRESRQNLWWYLLLIAFAFLAIETFLANRISTAWRT